MKITFDVSYAYYTGFFGASSFDTLQVLLVDPCSGAETILWAKGGAELSTAPATTAQFVPTDNSQWRREEAFVANFNGLDLAQFVFRSVSGQGNVVYLDNIIIENTTGAVAQISSDFEEICAGSPINFYSESIILGNPAEVNYIWEFEGGTPAQVTTEDAIGVVFNTPGVYDIILTVFTSTGGDSKQFADFITVVAPFDGDSSAMFRDS